MTEPQQVSKSCQVETSAKLKWNQEKTQIDKNRREVRRRKEKDSVNFVECYDLSGIVPRIGSLSLKNLLRSNIGGSMYFLETVGKGTVPK